MRVLHIRLKNLNSLAGEWQVDLTHPAYVADGLFAITGPTGAGKTTLLDALCLALYGRTPRLPRIGKSGNEIMSRHTGECFAEVVFETDSGRYRCHWGHHRARRRAGGELQVPRHEIARADDGHILESSLRGVAERVESLTGMDFERFTRSMLLAQGGFAAFLQAAPDERSPLLEQITGTEIYSRISMQVHECLGRERQALEAMQAQLAGEVLLSDDALAELQERRRQLTDEAADWGRRAAGYADAVRCLEALARRAQEGEALEAAQAGLAQRLTAFAPLRQRFDAARRALELVGPHASLSALREAQQADEQAKTACHTEWVEWTQAAATAGESLTAARDHLAAARQAQRDAQPALQAARVLDVRLAEKATALRAMEGALAEQSAQLAVWQARHRDETEAAAREADRLREMRTWAQSHRVDEGLVPALDALRARFDAQAQHHADALRAREEAARCEQVVAQADAAYREQARQVAACQPAVRQQQTAWLACERAVAEALADLTSGQSASPVLQDEVEQAGRAQKPGAPPSGGGEAPALSLAEARRHHAVLGSRREAAAQAHDAARAMDETTQALTALAQREQAAQAEDAVLTERLVQLAARRGDLSGERDALESQWALMQRIEDLEAARHQLVDGQPCPLCGAESHPFAVHGTPLPDQTRARLATVRDTLSAVQGQWADAQGRQGAVRQAQARVGTERASLTERLEAARRRLDEAGVRWAAVRAAIEPAAGRLARLADLVAVAETQAGRWLAALERVEAAEQSLAHARQALEAAREAAGRAERALETAGYRLEEARRRHDEAGQRARDRQAQAEQGLAALSALVQPYGVPDLTMPALPQVLAALAERRDRWLAHEREMAALAQGQQVRAAQLAHLAEQVAQRREAEAAARAQWQTEQAAWQAWQHERRQWLGERRVVDEEARLSDAVERAEQAMAAQQQRVTQAEQARSQRQARLEDLGRTLRQRAQRLADTESAWRDRLTQAGFADEDDWRAACLSGAERLDLQQQADALARDQAATAQRQRDWCAAWDADLARAQALPQAGPDGVEETDAAGAAGAGSAPLANAVRDLLSPSRLAAQQAALAEATERRESCQRGLGDIGAQLARHDDAVRRRQAQRDALVAQQAELARWDALHLLIGSADGKKYRNFAQGLTFERVIGHANRQLRRMSDRYLLVRDPVQPLALSVVDAWQAGEVRSTRNLSGGESFIVSLALALGLAQMASRHVRVDSLFLDEGFGTLDEAALDTALDTLAGLRQDGKVIGVISHVPALKERIATQIRVVPATGGVSRLEGPGCVFVAP